MLSCTFQLMSSQPRGQTWPMSISSWSVLGGGTASSVSLRKCFAPQCTCRSFKKKHSCSTAVYVSMIHCAITKVHRLHRAKTSWVPRPGGVRIYSFIFLRVGLAWAWECTGAAENWKKCLAPQVCAGAPKRGSAGAWELRERKAASCVKIFYSFVTRSQGWVWCTAAPKELSPRLPGQ